MSGNTASASATDLPFAMTALRKARKADDPVEALSRAHEVINAALVETCDFDDYVKEGDPNYSVLAAENDRRHEALQGSILRIWAYPPKTLDEARRKVELLIKATAGCVIPENQVKALLRSFTGVREVGANGKR